MAVRRPVRVPRYLGARLRETLADSSLAPPPIPHAPWLPTPMEIAWSPDGRTFYYKAHDAQGRASFWAVPAAGGHPRLLVRFTDLSRPSSRHDFATDGRRLFFTIEDRESHVFVAEMVRK